MDLLLHLRGFVAVADCLSVSYAADELGIDQPLLSRRLRALEDHLGVQLIDRSRRRIALTPSGAGLLPRARALLDQADHLLAGVADSGSAALTLVLPPGRDPAPLARLVRLFDEHGLDVDVAEQVQTDAPVPGWQVERCSAESAQWVCELGIAGTRPGARAEQLPIRLGDLRPRRGRPGIDLLITEEDDLGWFLDQLRTAADHAGLNPGRIRTTPMAIARAEVMAGRAILLGPSRAAERYGLPWARLLDDQLRRWYRLVETPPLPAALQQHPLRERALQLITVVLDAERLPDQEVEEEVPLWSRP